MHQREKEQGRADRRRLATSSRCWSRPPGGGPGTRPASRPGFTAVRRFGGARNKGAIKRAITATADTLLKIAYQVLETGTPYTDLGADFYASRGTPRPGRTT